MADDLRADALGCAGHPFIETPTIDRLAAEGVLFENAFVITPLCYPSRATFFTGRSTYAHGLIRNGMELARATPTFVPLLKDAGYATAHIGMVVTTADSDPRPGFDDWVTFRKPGDGGSINLFGTGNRYYNSVLNVAGQTDRDQRFSTDVLAEHAARWIRARDEGPFFLYFAIKNPHVPLTPAVRHVELYADVEIPRPESFWDPVDLLPEWIRRDRVKAPLIIGAPLRQFYHGLRKEHAGDPLAVLARRYAQMVPSIDDAVRRITNALEKQGALDNTVIIFTSDNGMLLGEHGLLGKELAYEESLRVPLIIRDPRVKHAGQRRTQQVLNLDWAPTILDFAGVAPPAQMTGRSVVPLLASDTTDWRREWLMVAHAEPRTDPPRPEFLAVRTDDAKYVRFLHGRLEEQLFDLRSDPKERRNLAAEPASAALLATMRERMRALMEREGLAGEWFEPFE